METPQQIRKCRKITKIPPSIQHSDAVKEVAETSHGPLPPMPRKSAFIFHHNFYPKSKIDLKDAEISEESR